MCLNFIHREPFKTLMYALHMVCLSFGPTPGRILENWNHGLVMAVTVQMTAMLLPKFLCIYTCTCIFMQILVSLKLHVLTRVGQLNN